MATFDTDGAFFDFKLGSIEYFLIDCDGVPFNRNVEISAKTQESIRDYIVEAFTPNIETQEDIYNLLMDIQGNLEALDVIRGRVLNIDSKITRR